MAEPQTCGQGLAEHSALPRTLGDLTDALAENLELHMRALDPADDAARPEHAAYASLAARHRHIAAQLRSVSEEMAGQRDLPMGRHDPDVLSSPEVLDAFARFIAAEREVATLLERWLERDDAMLRDARGR
jgi:hypothetical protein